MKQDKHSESMFIVSPSNFVEWKTNGETRTRNSETKMVNDKKANSICIECN